MPSLTSDKPKYLSVIVQENIVACIEQQAAKKSLIHPGSRVTSFKQVTFWVISLCEKQGKQCGVLRGSLEEVKTFTLKVTSKRDLTLQIVKQFPFYFQNGKTIKKNNKR